MRVGSVILIAGLLVLLLAGSAAPAAESTAALETQLQRLPHWGTVIYTTAHPDDESAGILTYLARGLHARVVLLCLTRGEGGQNQTGPELWEELGWVRTRELQRAVAAYGAEVRFMGAVDFGYSKSLEETLSMWDEEAIIGELVRQIRELKPVAVISNWSGTQREGAGQHQAAGVMTRQAFALAGDPNAFPEQLAQGLNAWKPRYLLTRARGSEDEQTFELPVRQPSPVPGKTFEELGWEGFQNHRSQGMHKFDLSQARSFIRRYLFRVETTQEEGPPPPTSAGDLVPGLAALPDLFPTLEWPRLEEWRDRLQQVESLTEESRERLAAGQASDATLKLVQGANLLAALRREFGDDLTPEMASARAWVWDREQDFLRAAADMAGVELVALTDRATVTPGERVWVGLGLRMAKPRAARAAGLEPGGLQLLAPEGWQVDPIRAETTPLGQRAEYAIQIPNNVDPQTLPVPVALGRAQVRVGGLQLTLEAPVHGLIAGAEERPGAAERVDARQLLQQEPREEGASARLEPLSVCPAVTLAVEPKLRLLPARGGETTRDFRVHLKAFRNFGKCSAWFDVPAGWYTPVPQETELAQPSAATTLHFPLTVPERIVRGRHELQAKAGRGVDTFGLTRKRVEPGPTREGGFAMPSYLYEPARATVQVVDVDVPSGLHIGYVGFSDDPVPELLAGLGITVTMLDEQTLAEIPLEVYDAVVVSNRMYDALPGLAEQSTRLLDYVQSGGVLLVEHQGRRWDPNKFAPYPGEKTGRRNQRVTDETAGVRMLEPDHPVWTFPNRISDDDWQGWVQERGLYFWESWSAEYTPLMEMADPGEEPLRGALLYARHGQGAYIYSGLSLFRQVRAGVPGGVRLYVNLLSQRRALTQSDGTSGN